MTISPPSHSPPSLADIDAMATWGFNSVRLPMHYDLLTLAVDQEPKPGVDTWKEDGFKRIDAFDDAVLRMPVLGRVSWLAPAGGIMLRRFTRRGGDAAFVRDDLTDLLTIADALAARCGRPH